MRRHFLSSQGLLVPILASALTLQPALASADQSGPKPPFSKRAAAATRPAGIPGARAPSASGRKSARPRRKPQGNVPPSAARAFDNPHGKVSARPKVNLARHLPPGEIEVHVVSTELDSVANRTVVLHVKHMSIAEGNSETIKEAVTDSQGVARFTNQPTTSDYVYSLETAEGPATYKVPEFQFRAGRGGSMVTLPIFPATTDMGSLVLMSRGLMAIVPKNNRFMIDLRWRIENYSKTSWAPKDVIFELPEGFQALTFEEKPGTQFVRHGDRAVRLEGTFTPGRHDLVFRFFLPINGEPTKAFSFPAKLNLGSFKVYLESGPSMTLEVAGFEDAEEGLGRTGKRHFIASRDFMEEKSAPPSSIDVVIEGIPTPPAGRGLSVGLAIGIALLGLGQALFSRRRKQGTDSLTNEEVERAQALLLDELVGLEKAFERKEVGRKMHERTRRQLLEAYARLTTASSGVSPS